MDVGNVDNGSPEKTGAEREKSPKKVKGVDAAIVNRDEDDTDTDSDNWILMIETDGKSIAAGTISNRKARKAQFPVVSIQAHTP